MTAAPAAQAGSSHRAATTATQTALRLRNVSKTFPGVRALDSVDLEVRAGTVHALLGHNGSGKSTLIKCLAGVYTPDTGADAQLAGQALTLGDARDAVRKGLRFVHQDLGIVPELSVADNVGFVAGYERRMGVAINWRRQVERSMDMLRRFGFIVDPDQPLGELSPPERTAVAIVRAVADWESEQGVLVLDEPTAALPAHEVDVLFELIREISGSGAGVILVSHRLDEVMAIADHATVLRDGRGVWDGALEGVRLNQLVDLVSGVEHTDAPATGSVPRDPESALRSGPPVIEVTDLHGQFLRGVSLSIPAGQILGVAGLLGSGREELPYIVSGAQTHDVTGKISVDGRTVTKMSVPTARALGISLVPADRVSEGVFDGFTTTENVSLGALPRIRRWGYFTPKAERRLGERLLRSVNADVAFAPRPIVTLSGGNQQKTVLARALSVDPRVLVLSEPTAGIDVGARKTIYDELRRQAATGLTVIMASSDVEDLLACCDRVVAIRDGVVVDDFTGARMTKSAVLYAVEGARDEQV